MTIPGNINIRIHIYEADQVFRLFNLTHEKFSMQDQVDFFFRQFDFNSAKSCQFYQIQIPLKRSWQEVFGYLQYVYYHLKYYQVRI